MQPVALHAPWIADPWRTVAQVLLGATVFAALMSYVGAFGLDDDPVVIRTAYLVVLSWIGAAFCMLAYRVARRVAWARERFLARVVVADLLVVVPSAVVTLASTWLFRTSFGFLALPIFLLNSFLMSGAFIAAVVAPAMDAAARRTSAMSAGTDRADFRDRLPPRLRGAELWALEAEDHYLKVITSGRRGAHPAAHGRCAARAPRNRRRANASLVVGRACRRARREAERRPHSADFAERPRSIGEPRIRAGAARGSVVLTAKGVCAARGVEVGPPAGSIAARPASAGRRRSA